jgi:hypothetical protein
MHRLLDYGPAVPLPAVFSLRPTLIFSFGSFGYTMG